MGKIQFISVNIALEEDGELIRRIKASADARGISFETALEDVVNIGLWPHITRNMDLVDRLSKETTV